MPNCGIHAARSTNWNGVDADMSKRAHSNSVTPNVRIDTASAMLRIRPSFAPSRFGMARSSSAPMIGRVIARVSRPGTSLSPQVVGEHGDHAYEHRCRIGLDRPVLQQAEHHAHAADEIACAVDRAVDDLHVEAAP